MINKVICINCGDEFVPSKNDKRIKYCCDYCRNESRKKEKYTTNWAKLNSDKVKTYRNTRSDIKNSSSKIKYATDDEYREKRKDQSKKYRELHPEKRRNSDLINKFGINIDDYDTMLYNQDNKCAICMIEVGVNKYSFHVDHDHITGKVRGLLCGECNLALGKFKDNIDIVSRAFSYLKGDIVG